MQKLEPPPPYLSASIATSLHKSCGYICKGESSPENNNTQQQEQEQQVVHHQNADGSFTTTVTTTKTSSSSSKEISSVKELLECQEKEIGGMKKLPGWATKILDECALKEE